MNYEYKLTQFLSIFMVGLLAFGCIGSQPQEQSYAPPIENALPSDANEQNHTNVQEQDSNESENMVGNDRDEHGCIGSAGYIWCEPLQKCIRPWEEACEAISVDETGVLPEPQMFPPEEQMPALDEQIPYENEPQMPPMDEPMPPEDLPMEDEPFPDEPPMGEEEIMP